MLTLDDDCREIFVKGTAVFAPDRLRESRIPTQCATGASRAAPGGRPTGMFFHAGCSRPSITRPTAGSNPQRVATTEAPAARPIPWPGYPPASTFTPGLFFAIFGRLRQTRWFCKSSSVSELGEGDQVAGGVFHREFGGAVKGLVHRRRNGRSLHGREHGVYIFHLEE